MKLSKVGLKGSAVYRCVQELGGPKQNCSGKITDIFYYRLQSEAQYDDKWCVLALFAREVKRDILVVT